MKPYVAAMLCVAGALAGDVVVEKHLPQPYKFGYESQDEWGNAQSRHEQDLGDGVKTGSYGYRDALGIFRHVNYVADHAGFRAWVKTNEPGTADSAPAAAKIEKNSEVVLKAAPILTAQKTVVAPVAASPVAVYAHAPRVVASAPLVAVRPRVQASYAVPVSPVAAAPLGYGHKLAAGPIFTGPKYASYAAPVSAPLVLAASRVAPAPAVHAVPVPVRKIVGPSAAAYVKPLAPVVSRLVASPKVVSGPILSSGGLHTASSDAIVVAPSIVSAPLIASRKRPYEKFADTFRRRRPIKTVGDKEVYVPPTLVTAGGIPVYKDK